MLRWAGWWLHDLPSCLPIVEVLLWHPSWVGLGTPSLASTVAAAVRPLDLGVAFSSGAAPDVVVASAEAEVAVLVSSAGRAVGEADPH